MYMSRNAYSRMTVPSLLHTFNNKLKRNKNTFVTKPSTPDMKINLRRLALVASLNILHKLPIISGSVDLAVHKVLKRQRNFMGFVNPSAVQDPAVIGPLHDYHTIMFDNHFNLIEGSFHFIVDTGCSMSCTPHKEDFSKL